MTEQNFFVLVKKHDWQDILFVSAIFFFGIFYFILFSYFHQFPSEYYGGDQYAHFGSAVKMYNTFNPFLSSHYYGELQHYPWLVPFLIASFSVITFQDPFVVAIFFPIFILLATMGITYSFGKRCFGSKTWALLLTIFWAVQLVPSFHPSEFAKQLMVPLLALFILLFSGSNEANGTQRVNENILSKKRTVALGIIYGFAGLEHMVTFVVCSVLFFCIVLLRMLEKKKMFWQEDAKKCVAVAVIGLSIASLFWAPIIIKYGGKTVNDWQEYTSETLLPTAEIVSGIFLESIQYGAGIFFVLSLLCMGIGLFFAFKNKDKRIFVPLLLIAATFLGIIHPYITYPLFGFSLGYYRFPIVLVYAKFLLVFFGIYFFWQHIGAVMLQKKQEITEWKKEIYGAIAVMIIILFLISFWSLIHLYKQSERYGYAIPEDEKIEAYRALQDFIQEKYLIEEKEVTVALHPDMAFLFNAMTGKNVMVTRITHATPFVDHNKRAADMAVLLYGNDSKKAEEIIKEYKLAYFFSEVGNIHFRSLCLKNWNDTVHAKKEEDSTVDAYWCLQTDPKYEQYLEQYGIETTTAYVRLAAGDQDVPLTKVLVIKPSTLQLQIEEIYAYTNKEGYVLLKLYRIVRASTPSKK